MNKTLVDELRLQIAEMHYELEQQQDYIEQLESESNTKIETFADGRYTDELRECCISLLSLGIGRNKIDPAIRTVLRLAGKTVERLPAPSTINNMIVEAGVISKLHLGEVLPTTAYNTLHTDGTTKFGEKYGSYQVSTTEASYSLALCEMKAGSAADTLEVLDQVITDIDNICDGLDDASSCSHQGKHIITTIKNTMSDRHSAEKKFNSLLEDYREQILSEVKIGWNDLSDEEKSGIVHLNSFFCGMHLMVGMAECANQALIEAEKAILGPDVHAGATKIAPSYCSAKEAGTIRLIRTVCNAVQKHGSQRAGVYPIFTQYLRTKGVDYLPLATFRGNRFNIVFHDAAGVFFLRDHLASFFEEYGAENSLLKAVAADLAEPVYLAGCKALGLINKLLTGPLWRVLESKMSILDMNEVYTCMRDQFKVWSEDASSFLEGQTALFDDTTIKHGEILDDLLMENSNNAIVQELLQVLFKSFYILCERLLVDHLPGGVHDKPSEEKRCQTQSVPKTNTVSERDFAQLDRFLREKPNATTIALESLILFSNNKTREWLQQKSDEQKAKIFASARKMAPKLRQQYQARRKAIEQHRAELIESRKAEREAKRRKKESQQMELVNEISMVGLWQTEEEVQSEISSVKAVKQKLQKLKQQIKFRKFVLQQEYDDPSVFRFSKNKKQFPVSVLMGNLVKLVNATSDPELEPTTIPPEYENDQFAQNPELIVGKTISTTPL